MTEKTNIITELVESEYPDIIIECHDCEMCHKCTQTYNECRVYREKLWKIIDRQFTPTQNKIYKQIFKRGIRNV